MVDKASWRIEYDPFNRLWVLKDNQFPTMGLPPRFSTKEEAVEKIKSYSDAAKWYTDKLKERQVFYYDNQGNPVES